MEEIRIEIENLREKLSHYAKMYYVYDVSEISDFEYDAMFRRLQELEAAYPQFDDVNSPTKRVGGRVLDKFEKITHAVQMGSLTDVFSFDELNDFLVRTADAVEIPARAFCQHATRAKNVIRLRIFCGNCGRIFCIFIICHVFLHLF